MSENDVNVNNSSDRLKVIEKLLDYDLKNYVRILNISTDKIRGLAELTRAQQSKLATALSEHVESQEYVSKNRARIASELFESWKIDKDKRIKGDRLY
jgi:hypothetical protein